MVACGQYVRLHPCTGLVQLHICGQEKKKNVCIYCSIFPPRLVLSVIVMWENILFYAEKLPSA